MDKELVRQRIHYLVEHGGIAPHHDEIEIRISRRQLLAWCVVLAFLAGAVNHLIDHLIAML